MKRQHNTMPTVDKARLLAARRRVRLQMAFFAILCAILGTACITSTVITDVSRKDGGESFIGQSMKVEFNQKVWDALKPEDRSQMGSIFDSFKTQGWQVGTEEGGRIQTATLDPSSLADLETKGWTISVSPTDNGKITTAKWLPGGSDSGDASGLQSVTVTIDESDPQTTRYKYQAAVLVKFEETPESQGSTSCGDDAWCQMMAQAAATAEADPQFKNVEDALKQSGPPKVVLGVNLPGNIESATLNGSPGGKTSGSQVTWDIVMDKNATHNVEATASGPGAGSSDPTSFGVTLSCNEDFADDPGQVICVAVSANAPQDAEIEFEWTFDGKVQGEKGRTLELHGVSKGEHTVKVVAIATNMNNLRSDPTGTTFTKSTGGDAPTPTATATASATTITNKQGSNITIITDENCSRKGETAGVVRVIAVPNGLDKDNIPLTGASAQKVKLKHPFPVNRGQTIKLPADPGWEVVYIQGPGNRTTIKGSSAIYTIACDDSIAAKITGGIANKWGDAKDTVDAGGELIKHGIDPQEAIDFGKGVVGPAIQNKKKENFYSKPLLMALGGPTLFGNVPAAPVEYAVAYTVDTTDPSVTSIRVYKGEVLVLPNNTDLQPVLLDASQRIDVMEDGLGPITSFTGSIGDPPTFEDELESPAQPQGLTQSQDGLNIWMLALIAVGLALLAIIGAFVIAGRKSHPQPAQVPMQPPHTPPTQPTIYYVQQPGPALPQAAFTCPYPDCVGQVNQGQKFCATCGRSLDPASVAAANRS